MKMKKFNLCSLKSLLVSAFIIFSITSCKDDGKDGPVINEDIPGYVFAEGAVAQIVNKEVKEGETQNQSFVFKLRAKSKENVEITFNYDESLVKHVNDKNKKNYIVFPQDLVNFSKKDVTVETGQTTSDSIEVTIKYSKSLEKNKEYLIPVKASVKKGTVSIPEKDSYLAIVVKPVADNTTKSTGIKIFSCMEINDANPLNHLSFKLKESGKYLFDAVILFSANMQYNEATKKVHLSLNPKNKFLFDNAEKYIKPLQDEGIKVLFSVLPHHTAAGLSNLTDETCKAFAAELKKFNDKYGLDGVFFDDEYGYKGAGDPSVLLPKPSISASSRLAYETKNVMPDKWVTVYAYSHLRSMQAVEGKKPGEFVDYALPDYFDNSDYTLTFEGLSKKQAGISSLPLSSVLPWNETYLNTGLQQLRDEGFGANMVYALNPDKYIESSQLKVLEAVTRILFDDELLYDGKTYSSEWADKEGDPEEWTGQ